MNITRKEWIRVIGFALFVAALTTLPYLLAWQSQTEDRAFSGALFGVEDISSYMAKMRRGAHGEWDFTLFYSPEPSNSEPGVYIAYLAAGQLIGAVVHDDAALPTAIMFSYQVMRIVCGIILILVIYKFIARFIIHERVRYNALVLATLAGGLGWITVLIPFGAQAMPDLMIPEGFTFLILYGLPHLALARAAMLTGMLLLKPPLSPLIEIQGAGVRQRRALRRVIIAGLLFNIVGVIVPFYLATIYAIMGVWGLSRWIIQRHFPIDLAKRAVPAALMTVPMFAYNAWVFTRNPAFAQWGAQNVLQSPPVFEYVLAYAPIVFFALIASRWAWNEARAHGPHAMLIGWVLAVPLLVYLPINVQRRLSEGIIIPLAILAAWGIRQFVWHDQAGNVPILPEDQRERRAYQRGRTLRTLLIIAFLCATTILWVSTGALASLIRNPPAYIETTELRAFAWLDANAPPESRILASWMTGNALPIYANMRPMLGLGPETLMAEEKDDLIQAYYRGELDAAAREALYNLPCTDRWLRYPAPIPPECRVRYVMFGETERELLPPGAVPIFESSDELTLVYEDGDYHIYQVAQPPA